MCLFVPIISSTTPLIPAFSPRRRRNAPHVFGKSRDGIDRTDCRTYRKRDGLKSSPRGEDTGEGGPKHQLILSAKARSRRELGREAVRAQLDLPVFFENLAGNHGSGGWILR